MSEIIINFDKNLGIDKFNKIMSNFTNKNVNVKNNLSFVDKDFLIFAQYNNQIPVSAKILIKDDIISSELIELLIKYGIKVRTLASI